jgi:hypothetical protein
MLLACGSAHADNFGFLAGMNFATFNLDNIETKTQFTGGFLYEAQIMPMFSLQPELRYNNKSAGPNDLNYIEIPVLGKVNIPTNTLFTPSIELGPDLGFNVSGNGANTIDFAWDFGVGLNFEVAPAMSTFVDWRYSLGLTNVVDGSDLKTRDMNLLFGVKFSI